MGLKDFAGAATLPEAQLRALVCEREGRLANKRELYLSLVTFMNVLEDPVPLTNLGSGQGMDRVAQIRHNGLAHLLLLRDRCDFEFAWLLLGERERRLFGLLGVCLAIHPVSDRPWRNALQLELRDLSNTEVLSSIEWDYRGRFCDVYPD